MLQTVFIVSTTSLSLHAIVGGLSMVGASTWQYPGVKTPPLVVRWSDNAQTHSLLVMAGVFKCSVAGDPLALSVIKGILAVGILA